MGIRKGAICTGGRSKGDCPFEVALPHLLSLVPWASLACAPHGRNHVLQAPLALQGCSKL